MTEWLIIKFSLIISHFCQYILLQFILLHCTRDMIDVHHHSTAVYYCVFQSKVNPQIWQDSVYKFTSCLTHLRVFKSHTSRKRSITASRNGTSSSSHLTYIESAHLYKPARHLRNLFKGHSRQHGSDAFDIRKNAFAYSKWRNEESQVWQLIMHIARA